MVWWQVILIVSCYREAEILVERTVWPRVVRSAWVQRFAWRAAQQHFARKLRRAHAK